MFWAYPENLVKIGLLVEAVHTFCGMGTRTGHGTHIVIIWTTSALALALALGRAEVCQYPMLF